MTYEIWTKLIYADKTSIWYLRCGYQDKPYTEEEINDHLQETAFQPHFLRVVKK